MRPSSAPSTTEGSHGLAHTIPPSGWGGREAQDSELLGLKLPLPYPICEAMDKLSLPLSISFLNYKLKLIILFS